MQTDRHTNREGKPAKLTLKPFSSYFQVYASDGVNPETSSHVTVRMANVPDESPVIEFGEDGVSHVCMGRGDKWGHWGHWGDMGKEWVRDRSR